MAEKPNIFEIPPWGPRIRILIVGSGGREHALGWALSRSKVGPHPTFAPGNAGTEALGPSVAVDPLHVPALLEAARDLRIDLTIVGPESPLAAGIVDRFREAGLPIVGPTRAAARIESSKAFAKSLMDAAGIPTAPWQSFETPDAALAWVRAADRPVVVKADGLAGGKGVTVCAGPDEAAEAVTRLMVDQVLGEAGRRIVVEEALAGEELSVLAVTDGRSIKTLLPARDHKRLEEGDRGPNTGGMGAVAPVEVTPAEETAIAAIFERTIGALRRRGTPYSGILYAGLMLTADGPKVLEFNCRFGDPEAQVILPLLAADPLDFLMASIHGTVSSLRLRWHPGAAVGIVLAGGRYPQAADPGLPISGVDDLEPEVLLFHGGTQRAEGRLVTAGGRVLTVVARADSVEEARQRALAAAERIQFPGRRFRRDIGLSSRERAPVSAASTPPSAASTPPSAASTPPSAASTPLPVAGGAPLPGEGGEEGEEGSTVPAGRRRALVGIVVGSDSDLPVVEEAARVLDRFEVPYEVKIASAHRAPEWTRRLAREAEGRGWRVIIAGAGGAAHLAGALAAQTVLPVIGVPLEATPLGGMDALLATAQMPPGVPVATMAVGGWGMTNAALLAVQILSTADERLRERFRQEKAGMAQAVEEKSASLTEPARTDRARGS